MDMVVTRAVLIQAGPTPWDGEGRIVGAASLPLTAEAKDAIRHLLENLPFAIEGVYHPADNEACHDLAQIIAHKFNLRARDNVNLEEFHLGLWEGLPAEVVRSRFPTVFPQWEDHPLKVTPPDGESLEAGIARIKGALARILRRNRGSTVAFALRPMAQQIASGILHGQNAGEIAKRLHQTRAIETIELDMAQLKAVLD
jgi:broad specificity phosphatase PhoE